jgi:predicted Zn finger-like uncharacterized protein
MALATQCPHCKTIFRVAQDQLKLRGGIVRCGACHEIFDGSASLVDMQAAAAAPTEAPVEAPAAQPALAAQAADSTSTASETTAVSDEELPVYALDLGAALDPLGILPKPEAEDEPAHSVDHGAAAAVADEPPADELALDGTQPEQYEPDDQAVGTATAEQLNTEAGDDHPPAQDAHEAEEDETPAQAADEPEAASNVEAAESQGDHIEPELDHHGEELVATVPAEEQDLDFGTGAAGLEHAAAHTPLPQRESAEGAGLPPPPPTPKSARARQLARRSKLTPTKIDAPKLRVPEIDEPEFVKRGRQREQSGRRQLILMAAGSVVLLLLLAAQAAVIFRNDLVARMPGTRPALVAMCSVLHCRVELPARIDNLTIETGELQTLGPNTYVLATLLHNQGGARQAWPAIELALTDATDKPLVRRVFAPADYLPKDAAASGFAAHGEQAVRLYFRLDQLKPSGYHIAVFYP